MKEFQLRFFGGLVLTLGDEELSSVLSVKARGLVCYLASTGRPQARGKLAGMFWAEKPEADALRSLRVDLTKIRKYLSPYIEATRQTIAFKSDENYWLDTETFAHHLRLGQHADSASARTHLREAVQLYTGDFLDGYQAGDAYGFEEWLTTQQENYRIQAQSALDKLLELHIEFHDFEAAIACANQILQIDPWREETHRRLMQLYMQNDQRGAALRQYDICRKVLLDEVGVEPELNTVQLWQQIKEQAGKSFVGTQPLPLPQATTGAKIPFQVPPEVPFFSGRDAELAQIKAQFERSEQRQVVCLAGMGGVGKTSIAVQVSYQCRDYFPDGVLWASADSDPAMIAERWAAAYGYDFRGIARESDRLVALRDMLAKKRALIVVDGVEVAARVKPLFPTDGHSVVLFTTRNAELAYSLGAVLFNLDGLTLEDGRSLLSNIIGKNRVEKEQVVAEQICQLLQNLPLALAIAGQYLASRPRRKLAAYLNRLQKSALLDVVDMEGAVRASFDISWLSLDLVQQRVFTLVALFNGRSFAAEAIAHIAELDFYVIQDQLDTLSARSLLIEQGSDYYRQHTLLAHFADEKLTDRQSSSLRLVNYYEKFTDVYGGDYPKLNEEWDNLDASIQMMANEGLWQTLFRVNQNLNQAWFAQGLFARAAYAYKQAYEGALIIEDKAQIGESLYRQGMALLEQGQYDEARVFFEQAQIVFEDLGDTVSVSDVEYEVARIHIFQGRYDQATSLLGHGLQVKQALNDQQGVGQFKYRQAVLLNRLQKFDELLNLSHEVIALQEQLGSTLDLIRTLRLAVWAYCYCEEPNYTEAKTYGERALMLAEELGDQGEQAVSLSTLAEVNRWQKNYEVGLRQAQESLALLEKMGDIASQASATLRLCGLYREMQSYDESLFYGNKSLMLYKRISDKLGNAQALGNIGVSYMKMGEVNKATEHLLASSAIAMELKNQRLVSKNDRLLQKLGYFSDWSNS